MLQPNNIWQRLLLLQALIFACVDCFALTITKGNCQKNISVKYQVPVTKTRLSVQHANELLPYAEQFVDYEERTRWDIVSVCCPGYRTIIFGFCEPICADACPPHSYCAEPNHCVCGRGYEASHHANREHQLICRPICVGGCPAHSHCVAHNQCECRAGFRDVSAWFSVLRCERIQCGADQRYDVARRACVKIEMSVEELMQKVAEKLARGLNDTAEDSDEEEEQEEELPREEKFAALVV